jgi:hypothetical protein
VLTSFWRPSSPARPVEECPLLTARPGRPMEGSPPWQLSPQRRRWGPVPPLRVQSRVAEQEDCKWILSVFSTIDTWQLAKTTTQYLEDSTSWALRLRPCRWPFGTGGRAPANSTLWSEELSRRGSPSTPPSACESTHSADSLLPWAAARRAFLAAVAAAGRGSPSASPPACESTRLADSLLP